MRICGILSLLYSYLDRQALPNARVQGIDDDLGLVGDEYNVAISVLFAGYIALQIPSNMILTRVRPSIYLPLCMALWSVCSRYPRRWDQPHVKTNDYPRGVVSACTAAVKDFHGLVACRFFLGFLEAPFFPGALFLLSAWYTPKELATRTAVLYTGSLLSSAFGGLVGAGVQYGLDGVRGLHAWQWLFVIEGSATVFLSLCSIFLLPDFPATTRWLSERERAVARDRLHRHSGFQDEERGPLLRGIRLALADYKVWLLTAVVITKTTAAAVTSFIPTLVATFEFSSVQSLLLTAPPYVFAAAVAMAVSISSDRHAERYFHLVGPLCIGMVGYIVAASTTTLAPRYFSLFLMLGGVYGSFNVTYAWISSTVSFFSINHDFDLFISRSTTGADSLVFRYKQIPRPLEKRAAAFAFANMVGNFAQIYSPYMYDKSSGPRYLPAMTANTVFVFASVCFATALRLCLARENRGLDALEGGARREDEAEAGGDLKKHDDDIVQEGRAGPLVLSHGFRYTL